MTKAQLFRVVRDHFARLTTVAQSEQIFHDALAACERDEREHRAFMARRGQRRYALSVDDTARYFVVHYLAEHVRPPTKWADFQIKAGAILSYALDERLRERLYHAPVVISDEFRAIDYARDIALGDR